MFDENRYTIYKNKDGRWRVYDKETKKVFSYPRLLMANKLGRSLEAGEDVHHIDGNTDNNSLDNLEIIDHKEHDRIHAQKYDWEDLEMICPECGNIFIWTIKQQKNKHNIRDMEKSGPYCSRHCCGIHNQKEQMRRKMHAECA